MKSRQNLSSVKAFFKAFFTTSLIIIIISGCAFLYFNYFDGSSAEANTPSQLEIFPREEENFSLLLVIDDLSFIKIDYAPAEEELSFQGISNQRAFENGITRGTLPEIALRKGYSEAAECVEATRYAYFAPNNLYAFAEFLGDFSFELPKDIAFHDKETKRILTMNAGLQTLDARRMCGIISELSKEEEQEFRDYLIGKTQDDSENKKLITDIIVSAIKTKICSGADIEEIFNRFTSLSDTDISAYDYELRHSGFKKLLSYNKLKFTVKEVAK